MVNKIKRATPSKSVKKEGVKQEAEELGKAEAGQPSEGGVKQQKGIQSVEIGYKLLMGFSSATGALSLKQLAQAAGMTPAKAYFYLTSFTRVGLVERLDQGALYRLGPGAINLGLTALSQIDALQKARDAIGEIRNHPTLSAFISVMGSHGPNVIYRMQGAHWSPYEVRLGAILPRISATGRALIASLSPQMMLASIENDSHLKDFGSPFRKVNRQEALKLCEEVHEHGVAIGGSFVAPNFASVAAPVYDHDGNIPFAITLVGYKGEIDLDYEGEDARRVLVLCTRLSEEMGWRGPKRK